MATRYNPVTNRFVEYTPTPSVTIKYPLIKNPVDISDFASQVIPNEDGSTARIIAKPNLPDRTTTKMEPQNNNRVLEELEPLSENTNNILPSTELSSNSSYNKNNIMEFFINKGLSRVHAAGIVGNLYGESALNPTALNKSSKAFGLAQWLGPRKKALFAKYGENPTFDLQLEFIWEELKTTERKALNKLLATNTVEEATRSFVENFERPSRKEIEQSIGKRTKYAKSLV